MSKRRNEGDETWHRLLSWSRGQQAAERLAALVLSAEGYEEIDPQHPRGGPDGRKDILCKRNGVVYVASVYFPSGQQKISAIQRKISADVEGVEKNRAGGFVVITNQELLLAERAIVKELAKEVEIFHLERLASILNRPASYGLRLEFLDIEMTKEEQLAFLAERDTVLERLVTRATQQDRVADDQLHAKAVYVTPKYHYLTAALSLAQDKVKQCSYCNYGYIVNTSRTAVYASAIDSEWYVTCPKCGSSESIPRPYF